MVLSATISDWIWKEKKQGLELDNHSLSNAWISSCKSLNQQPLLDECLESHKPKAHILKTAKLSQKLKIPLKKEFVYTYDSNVNITHSFL